MLANGVVSQGVKETPGPWIVAQCLPPGPVGQPHQSSVASTEPEPPLSIAVPLEKLLKWAFSCEPAGAVKPMSMPSLSKVFCSTTVPLMGAALETLMPVGPLVGAPGLSGPLPENTLPMILLLLKFTGGAIGEYAWLCMATPVAPLFKRMLLITRLPLSVVPGKGAKIPTPAPAPWVPLPMDTFMEMVLSETP